MNSTIASKKSKVDDEDLVEPGINWIEDKVNPCSDPLKLDLYTTFIKIDNFYIWFIDKEAFVLCLPDSSVFISSQNCQFLNHIRAYFYQNVLGYDVKLINTGLFPKVLRSYNLLTNQLEFEIPFDEFRQIFIRANQSNQLNYESKQFEKVAKEVREEKSFYQQSIENIKVSNKGPTEVIHFCETEEGQCEAFNDGTVKIKFNDRTLIWFYAHKDFIKIISSMGDYITMDIKTGKEGNYKSYVDYTLSFWENVFLPKEYHEEQNAKKIDRENLIQNQLDENDRLMMMIDKGINLVDIKENKCKENYNDFNFSKSVNFEIKHASRIDQKSIQDFGNKNRKFYEDINYLPMESRSQKDRSIVNNKNQHF